jgi:hypothetical protein
MSRFSESRFSESLQAADGGDDMIKRINGASWFQDSYSNLVHLSRSMVFIGRDNYLGGMST